MPIFRGALKPESMDSFRKYMNQYGFDGDWDEVLDLLSPIGLLTAYLRMCSIDIEIEHPEKNETKTMQFGDVFRCDDESYITCIPITIFKYYNISPSAANALMDRSLTLFIMEESGIEFSYSYAPQLRWY